MLIEIHCPNCGEFKYDPKNKDINACPQCGSKQIIKLGERRDIMDRFIKERGYHTRHTRESWD